MLVKRRVRILLSLLCGALAAAGVWWYVDDIQSRAAAEREALLAQFGDEYVEVYVAARDIVSGETLDEGAVVLEEWAEGLVPAGALTSRDEVIGRQATSNVPARAVLSPVYFERAESAVEVPPGMVAVAVAVDAEHAVGGAIVPGDDVEVYVARDGIADLLCSARVVDTSLTAADAAQDTITWATLAVAPERVQEVLAATAQGAVSLVLPAPAATSTEEGAS